MNDEAINSKYELLDRINSPKDIKSLKQKELSKLADELREYIIETVQKTGGHLAPSLGTIELSVALHYVFDAPYDKLIWDVGHQAYGHKVLTGRREALKTIRQYKGISGFCKISESEYDAFGVGHASTSLSAGAGYAAVRSLEREHNHIISIIGDGAFTGGLVYEALNNVTNLNGQFLVVLNDNEMSISPNVGAMSNYLTRIVRNPKYIYYKNRIWDFLKYLPRASSFFRKLGHKILQAIKKTFAPSVLFEEFGFRYFGPIDGHDLDKLIRAFKSIKELPFPVLLHTKTIKGKGLLKAENDPTKYHGVSPEKNIIETKKADETPPPFLNAFGKIACEIAEKYEKAAFITAAMKDGTGLVEYADKFPARYYDVGIAEGHAVTFAAGLAAAGYRPVVAIYSTFLQRAYDFIIHDVTLQDLPVIFAIDRGGLVGADGPTHHGSFDISFLNIIPNLIIAAPRNGNELRDLLFCAIDQQKPFAVRYPKDSYVEFDKNKPPEKIDVGSWEILKEGKDVAIISTGVMTNTATHALQLLEKEEIIPTLVHARFIKPFDNKLLHEVAKSHKLILTIEDNAIEGGFGMKLSKYVSDIDDNCKVVSLGIPDKFIEQASREKLLELIGLSREGILKAVKKNL